MEIAWQAKETNEIPWGQIRLPPFSPVALRVVRLASQESVRLHELAELISSDPALATEVLTIVNSLVYALRFPITSILQAIAVMGANHLQGLCLTVGVRGYLGETLGHPAMQALWRHDLACATVAEQLACGGFMDRDIAFTCGIMHDIGRLALAVLRPKEYIRLLESHSGDAASILEREREAFGMDHCQVGKRLISQWRLPEEFEPIVGGHHQARHPDAPWNMLDLISMSCSMVDTAGFAAFSSCGSSPFSELLDELPPRERSLFHTDAAALRYEILKKIEAIETI